MQSTDLWASQMPKQRSKMANTNILMDQRSLQECLGVSGEDALDSHQAVTKNMTDHVMVERSLDDRDTNPLSIGPIHNNEAFSQIKEPQNVGKL